MLGELVLQGVAALVATAVVGVVVAVITAYPLSKTPYYNPTHTDYCGRMTLEGLLDTASVVFWLGVACVITLASIGGVVEVVQWVV